VIVHLLAHDAQTLERMIRQLEGKEGVAGVEIGLPPGITPPAAAAMAQAALGELAVVARLPFEAAPELVAALGTAGINAISLAPPRGFLPGAAGALVSGRLYGPAILPHALARVKDLLPFGIPVIAAGGIYTERDAQAFLAAGAMAVQLDAVLWQGSFLLKEKA
jgi:glycerol-3-phosphate responsive antiterminator